MDNQIFPHNRGDSVSPAFQHIVTQPQHTPSVCEWLEESFEHDKDARFLVGEDNRLTLANEKARELIEQGLMTLNRSRQLRLGPSRSQSVLESGMNAARRKGDEWHYKAVTLTDGEWCAIRLRLIDATAALIEVVVRPINAASCDMSSIAEAFALTATESKVLLGLSRALCPKRIAVQSNLSVHTVRAHIRAIYAKLGTRTAPETQSLVLALLG